MSEIEDRIKRLSEPFDARFIQQKPGPGGRRMDFVSHGTVTKRLNERAPGWSSRIVASGVDVTQSPKGGLLYTADVTLELTVAGVTRAELGTNNQPVADRGQALKSAASDALKRAAMRFGVALDLWESLDEQDEDAQYATTPRAGSAGPGREAPAPRRSAAPADRPAAVPGAAGPPSPDVAQALVPDGAGGMRTVDVPMDDDLPAKPAKRAPTVAEALTAARNETLSDKARQYAAVKGLEAAATRDEAAEVYTQLLRVVPDPAAFKAAYVERNEALKEPGEAPF
jgi:hypothetical protein